MSDAPRLPVDEALNRFTRAAGFLMLLLGMMFVGWVVLVAFGKDGQASGLFELVKAAFYSALGLAGGYGYAKRDG